MTTANKITIARILMIPVFITLAIYYGHGLHKGVPQEWQRWAAVTVFGLAAVSDGLDGFIARRYNQRSQLGVILDPLADKGLLLSGIITLSFSNWHYEFPIWFPVLVIARDVVVVSGAILLHYFYGKVQVRPSWVGKVTTFLQMASIVGVMLQVPYIPKICGHPVLFLDALVDITGLFTFISGLGYVINGIRQLQAADHASI